MRLPCHIDASRVTIIPTDYMWIPSVVEYGCTAGHLSAIVVVAFTARCSRSKSACLTTEGFYLSNTRASIFYLSNTRASIAGPRVDFYLPMVVRELAQGKEEAPTTGYWLLLIQRRSHLYESFTVFSQLRIEECRFENHIRIPSTYTHV